MIYKVKPSVLKVLVEHALAYGMVFSYTYDEPFFIFETDKPFPDKELTAIGFEVLG